MKQLVSVESQVEVDLRIIYRTLPGTGMDELLSMMSKLFDDLRNRHAGRQVFGWDGASIRAMDEFLTSIDGVLVVDNSRVFFVAQRGLINQPPFRVTRAGVFKEAGSEGNFNPIASITATIYRRPP